LLTIFFKCCSFELCSLNLITLIKEIFLVHFLWNFKLIILIYMLYAPYIFKRFNDWTLCKVHFALHLWSIGMYLLYLHFALCLKSLSLCLKLCTVVHNTKKSPQHNGNKPNHNTTTFALHNRNKPQHNKLSTTHRKQTKIPGN